MKKLGKKIHNSMQTIEAYVSCDGACRYDVCGNTSAMVNLLLSIRRLYGN